MSIIQKKNRELFDKEAEFYNNKNLHMITSIGELYKELLVSLIKIKEPKIIIDIGCGTGFIYNIIMDTLNEQLFIGIDISFQMLKKHKNNCILIQATAEELPIKDESVNCFIIANTLHHFEDYKNIIQILRNKLKKNGLLIIINEPNKKYYHRNITCILRLLLRFIVTATIKKRDLRDYENSAKNFNKTLNMTKEEINTFYAFAEVHGKGLDYNSLQKLSGFKTIEKKNFAYLGAEMYMSYPRNRIHLVAEKIQKILFPDTGELFYIVLQKT